MHTLRTVHPDDAYYVLKADRYSAQFRGQGFVLLAAFDDLGKIGDTGFFEADYRSRDGHVRSADWDLLSDFDDWFSALPNGTSADDAIRSWRETYWEGHGLDREGKLTLMLGNGKELRDSIEITMECFEMEAEMIGWDLAYGMLELYDRYSLPQDYLFDTGTHGLITYHEAMTGYMERFTLIVLSALSAKALQGADVILSE